MNKRKFRNWLKRAGYLSFSAGDSKDIQAILNGDRRRIMYAFLWSATPQSDIPYFWENRENGKIRLSKRTRSFLAKLRDEAKRGGF